MQKTRNAKQSLIIRLRMRATLVLFMRMTKKTTGKIVKTL